MRFEKYLFFKISIFFIIITSFFVGFILRDFAPGGASGDFNVRIWPLLQSFKDDFIFTIENYGKFHEGSYPLFFIINAYLNPFLSDKSEFLFSVTFISFLVPILFAFLLKNKLPKITWFDCFLTSSTILLLPFYRSSAYWGTTENFGWLFFVLSLYFFFKINSYGEKNEELKIANIFYFCLFSACALYIRPALVFLPISFYLYLFFCYRNKKLIIYSTLFYLILSIPGLILIYIWGGLYDTHNWGYSFTERYHSYKFIPKNFPILLSYFAFYFFPILFLEYFEIGVKKIFFKYINPFLFSIIILISLWQLNFLNYLGNYKLGGGAILKLNYILKEENFLLLMISSAIGFAVLYRILQENFKQNICIFLPILIIYGFPKQIYQEYFEPLILFIFLSGFLFTDLNRIYFKNLFFSNLILFLYFTFYLVAATYYKHFI